MFATGYYICLIKDANSFNCIGISLTFICLNIRIKTLAFVNNLDLLTHILFKCTFFM